MYQLRVLADEDLSLVVPLADIRIKTLGRPSFHFARREDDLHIR